MEKTIIAFHGCGQDSTLFKSLLKSLHNNIKNHGWIFWQGPYAKDGGGWGWYKYKDDDSKIWKPDMKIDQGQRLDDIHDMLNFLDLQKHDIILLGFSEGAQFALDLAQHFPADNTPSLKGVVAISPSYSGSIAQHTITCPVVLITSEQDSRVSKKYSEKWRKICGGGITEINHQKGHKVYLPKETRDIIKDKLGL